MRLSDWAEKQGINYMTAWRWFKHGKMPVKAIQTPSGMILVEDDIEGEKRTQLKSTSIYARVSSHDQKKDLEGQVARMSIYAANNGLIVTKILTEIGSGLNGNRKKLLSILADKSIDVILVEHKDRLTRFGFEYIETLLRSQSREVIVVDKDELSDDLVRDMIEVLTSFCARLYGKRSARNKALKAIEAMKESKNESFSYQKETALCN
ncbi:MAG: IS607 family transposase [Bdellovibrionia bacterium]